MQSGRPSIRPQSMASRVIAAADARQSEATLSCLRNPEPKLLLALQKLHLLIMAGLIDPNTEVTFQENRLITPLGELFRVEPGMFEYFEAAQRAEPNSKTAERWRHIQNQALKHYAQYKLSSLNLTCQHIALLEAIETEQADYVNMLIGFSLEAMNTTEQQTLEHRPGALILATLRTLVRKHSPHLQYFTSLALSAVISWQPTITNEATMMRKISCLLHMALETNLNEANLGVRSLYLALYYLSHINDDTSVSLIKLPNTIDKPFPKLTARNRARLSELLDDAIQARAGGDFAQTAAIILRGLYTHPDRQLEASNPTQSATHRALTWLPSLVSHFKTTTLDVVEIEANEFMLAWQDNPQCQPIKSITDIATQINAVKTAMLTVCSKKITFEVKDAHGQVHNQPITELTASQQTEKLMQICYSSACSTLDLLKFILLIQDKADYFTKNNLGTAPLEKLCISNKIDFAHELIQILIQRGQINKLYDFQIDDQSLLDIACFTYSGATVRLLAQNLVDDCRYDILNTTTRRGQPSALSAACAFGQLEEVKLIVGLMVQSGHPEMLYQPSYKGCTPLAWACKFAQPECANFIIQQLLKHGYYEALQAQSPAQLTPFDSAVLKKCYRTACLVEKAIDDHLLSTSRQNPNTTELAYGMLLTQLKLGLAMGCAAYSKQQRDNANPNVHIKILENLMTLNADCPDVTSVSRYPTRFLFNMLLRKFKNIVLGDQANHLMRDISIYLMEGIGHTCNLPIDMLRHQKFWSPTLQSAAGCRVAVSRLFMQQLQTHIREANKNPSQIFYMMFGSMLTHGSEDHLSQPNNG